MDKVSNGPFLEVSWICFLDGTRLMLNVLLQKEFDRLAKVCSSEDVKLPTKQALEKKVTQMQKLVSQPMTEVSLSVLCIGLYGNKLSIE